MNFQRTKMLIFGAFAGYIASTLDKAWNNEMQNYTIGAFPIGSLLFVGVVLAVFIYEWRKLK